MLSKKKIVIFAYGFMGKHTYESFLKDKNIQIEGLILPNEGSIYYTNIEIKKIEKNIKILKSDNKKNIFDFIKKINPDLVIISTFNKILDKKILSLSKFVNIHHGKLPKQKGRASINWAIIMGRNNIYLTIHEVITKLDAGKIIKQKKFIINSKDNYFTIKNKINIYLKTSLPLILKKYLDNKINLKNNVRNKETWNCSRNPEDGMINFFEKRQNIVRLIKGTNDQNFGAYCFLKEKKITILEAEIKNGLIFEGIVPGRIININKNGSIDCLCFDGPINIKKIMYKDKIMKPSKLIKSTRSTLLND